MSKKLASVALVVLVQSCGSEWASNKFLVDAVERGWLEGVQASLAEHADPNARSGWKSALGAAVMGKSIPVLEVLLVHHANPNVAICPNRDCSPMMTPLMLAAATGRLAALQMLVQYGAEVDATVGLGSGEGKTALMYGAQEGQTACVEALLAAGADPNRTIPWVIASLFRLGAAPPGRTALMIAAMQGQPAIVERLLASGARPDTKDWSWNTARELAEASGHQDIAKMIGARR